MNNACQSCAMPLKKDPQQGGTNADGSKSAEYCSLCFENGQFTQPDFSVKDMQDFCICQNERMWYPAAAWLGIHKKSSEAKTLVDRLSAPLDVAARYSRSLS